MPSRSEFPVIQFIVADTRPPRVEKIVVPPNAIVPVVNRIQDVVQSVKEMDVFDPRSTYARHLDRVRMAGNWLRRQAEDVPRNAVVLPENDLVIPDGPQADRCGSAAAVNVHGLAWLLTCLEPGENAADRGYSIEIIDGLLALEGLFAAQMADMDQMGVPSRH